MTKDQWVSSVSRALGKGMSKEQTERVIDATFAQLTQLLAQGEYIRVPGFGTMTTKRAQGRQGRNPQTGAVIDIPAKTRVVFRPADLLKQAVQPQVTASPKKRAAAPAVSKPKTGVSKPKPKSKAKK